MTQRSGPKQPFFDFTNESGGLVKVFCEFCSGEPTRIQFEVHSNDVVDRYLVRKGWSILAGKEMCPKCARWALDLINKHKSPGA